MIQASQATADNLLDAATVFFKTFKAKQYSPVGVTIGQVYLELSVHMYHGEMGYKIGAIQNNGKQKQGRASKVLHNILNLADAQHVCVYLIPKPFGPRQGMNEESLIEWYTRYGFVPNGMVKRVDDATGEVIEEPLYKREAR